MTIQANDFKSNTLTGTVQVQAGTIAIPLATNKLILEGDKTFRVRIRKDNEAGQTLDISPEITLDDQTGILEFTPNVATVSEGESVRFFLRTTGVPNNYRIYYDTVGNTANVTSDDLSPFTGSVLVLDNAANITINVTADLSSYIDDNESFALRLRSDSVSGTVVGTSNSVVILDTSNAARVIGITLTRETPLGVGMYEGEVLRANIQTVNGEGNNAATLYYSTAGNALIFGANTGSFVVNDNYADFALTTETTIPDFDAASLGIQIRANSPTGTLLATSDTVTVFSYVSGIYFGTISRVDNVYPDRTTGYGDETFNFTVDLSNSFENETLYYRTTGNITTQTGSFVVSANTATVPITVPDPTVIRNVSLDVYRDNAYTKLLGQSNTSIEIIPNVEQFIGVEPFDENIVEGEGFPINIITNFGQPGNTTFYYSVTANGTIQSGLSGTLNSLSNLLVIPETNIPDGESREVQIRLRSGSPSGTVIYTSNLLVVDSYQGQTPYNPVTTLVSDITTDVEGYYFSGGSVTYTVSTIGIANDTLYYTLSGNVAAGELNSTSGSISVTGNSGQITLTGSGTASVNRTHKLQIRRGSTGGTLLGEDDEDIIMSTYAGPIVATGGTIEDDGGYRKHIFTTTANLQITTAAYNPAYTGLEYFVVGGGGGGGRAGQGGGGGGAGGWKTSTVPVSGAQGDFLVVVGGGGGQNTAGGNTHIQSLNPEILALGGGSAGGAGGSGSAPNNFISPLATIPGGAGEQPLFGGFGFPGGFSSPSKGPFPGPGAPGSAGGGGGAGAKGADAPSRTATSKPGGIGRALPWSPATIGASSSAMAYPNPAPAFTTGGTRYFAGGGGGSSEQGVTSTSPGGAGGGGAANPSAQYPNPLGGGSGRSGVATSGGGGGGGAHGNGPGGTGGGGVVIVRYPI